jgi:hypothetical protein
MMTLEQWIHLAGLESDAPLPPELREALAETAREVRRLAFSQGSEFEFRPAGEALRRILAPPGDTGRAAASMAKATGLTAGAIEEVRARLKEAYATDLFGRRCQHAPGEKAEVIEGQIADLAGIDPRTLRRWRDRTYRKLSEEVSIEDLLREINHGRRKNT